jgi:hypothetical protein
MNRFLFFTLVGIGLCTFGGDVSGRGFGGFGGFHAASFGGYGGYRGFSAGGYGGYRGYGGYDRSYAGYGGFDRGYSGFSSFGGADRYGGAYSGYHSLNAYSGWGGRGARDTYDHTWTDAAGGSVTTSGTRGVAEGRYGGVAAGGARDTTVTTASGRTYTADRDRGVVSGPAGRTVGGATGTVDGRYGSASWERAFSGDRYTGDMSHYASVYGANGLHSTAYWSTGYMHTRATYVRNNFNYWGCFHPAWYLNHPGCWFATGWVGGFAWVPIAWPVLGGFWGIPVVNPIDYDYGSNVIYQDNTVYMNGQPGVSAVQYADQATDLAVAGQTANAPTTDDWKPLGVFALVQGDDKTSNNIFQLAVNKAGIIRGNFYDGITDTTTDVYGSVDKKTQRAAWTIGKKKDRVFEAGIYNLTQPECPCLVHIGTQKTEQMLLVRMEQPKTNGTAGGQ